MTRWLVTGAGGMLGRDLARALADRNATMLGRSELDIRDAAAVRRAIKGFDVVVNAAAYTRVDDAESHEDLALGVNGHGAGIVARAAADAGARLVQISTDYVFRGDATEPYPEDAPLDPVSVYGRTKAEGERQVRAALPDGSWIIRTAWLYGAGGPNFAKTILRLAAARPTVSVVRDQIGQPTWAADLAEKVVAVVDSDLPAGIYHATSSGSTSWYGFARAVFDELGLDPSRVRPVTGADLQRAAPRPAWSVLGHDAWTSARVPPIGEWRARLHVAAQAGALQ